MQQHYAFFQFLELHREEGPTLPYTEAVVVQLCTAHWYVNEGTGQATIQRGSVCLGM